MRTPGHDEELALGFCLSEGLRPLGARVPDDLAANTVEVDAPGADVGRLQRSFYTSSSCGVCGKGALEAVAVEAPRVESDLQRRRRARRAAPGSAARGAGRVRGDRRAARDRALLRRAASCSACARTSAATTRSTRSSAARSSTACLPLSALDPLPQRPALVRARPEGGGRGLPAARRRRRAVVARGRAGRRPRDHALRLRPRRLAERLHRAVADPRRDRRAARRRRVGAVRLAEGARPFRWRDARRARVADARGGVPARLAVGKGDARAAVSRRRRAAGAAGAARRRHRRAPRRRHRDRGLPPRRLPARHARALARAGRARRPSPRPGRCRAPTRSPTCRSSSGGSRSGDWSLRGVNPRVLEAEPRLLANVNTPAELSALEQDLAALDDDRPELRRRPRAGRRA